MGNDSTHRHAGYVEVQPQTLDFGFLPGGFNETLQVSIVNDSEEPISWKADTGGTSWLIIVGHSSGQVRSHGRQEIKLKTDTAALGRAGTYLTTLNVVLLDTVNIQIPATIEFLGPRKRGELHTSAIENHIPPKSPVVTPGSQTTSAAAVTRPTSFSIAVASGRTGSMDATVSNDQRNDSEVTWNAVSSESWLTLSPAFSGTLGVFPQPDYSQAIKIIADATSLAPGQYHPTLTFTATDLDNFKSTLATVITVEVTVR